MCQKRESIMNRIKLGTLALAALTVTSFVPSQVCASETHHLALQISDNDPQKMNTVLNVAANASAYYSGIGEAVEIRVVAFNAGLHMLRADTSPVADRLKGFSESMPNVTFEACDNTIAAMAKKEGIEIPLVENAVHVPAGVVELISLDEAGWTILRP
jgi:intracellular sulfur oxidation DsrE/DsrF family protein